MPRQPGWVPPWLMALAHLVGPGGLILAGASGAALLAMAFAPIEWGLAAMLVYVAGVLVWARLGGFR